MHCRAVGEGAPDISSCWRSAVSRPFGLLVLALAACGDGDADRAAAYTVRDSAGITIVENSRPAWQDGEGLVIADEPALDIGVLDGPPEYQFDGVSGAARLSDGRIVVANSGSGELRFYGTDGEHLFTTGGEGEGPGEFEGSMWIGVLPGDSIVAWDPSGKRKSLFDRGGLFIASATVQDAGMFAQSHGVLPDGSLILDAGFDFTALVAGGQGVRRDTTIFTRLSSNGETLDTLGRFPGGETYVRVAGSSLSTHSVPLSGDARVAVGEVHYYVGVSDRYEIGVYDPDGTLRCIIRGPERDRELDAADIEIFEERTLSGITDENQLRMRRQVIDEVGYPSVSPAFSNLLVAANGNLWVSHFRIILDEPPAWDVFDPEGVWLGEVVGPPGISPRAVGDDWMLATWRDDFDVEHVRMYTITR